MLCIPVYHKIKISLWMDAVGFERAKLPIYIRSINWYEEQSYKLAAGGYLDGGRSDYIIIAYFAPVAAMLSNPLK